MQHTGTLWKRIYGKPTSGFTDKNWDLPFRPCSTGLGLWSGQQPPLGEKNLLRSAWSGYFQGMHTGSKIAKGQTVHWGGGDGFLEGPIQIQGSETLCSWHAFSKTVFDARSLHDHFPICIMHHRHTLTYRLFIEDRSQEMIENSALLADVSCTSSVKDILIMCLLSRLVFYQHKNDSPVLWCVVRVDSFLCMRKGTQIIRFIEKLNTRIRYASINIFPDISH